LEAVANLGSTALGLSAAEAARRLIEFGPNRIEKVAHEPIWLRFIKEFVSFFSVILWFAAVLAFFAEWIAPGQGMAKIGYAIVIVILVSGVFSFWQEFRVEKTLAALLKLLPPQVTALREAKVIRMSAEELVPGDIVELEQGDNIPADCRLIEAFGVRVDNAAVTGESLPLARQATACDAGELIRSKNILLAGTAMVSGQAKAVVFATGSNTEFGKIAHLVQTAEDEVSPLRREIAHLSRLTAFFAVVIGALFYAVGWAIGVSHWQAFIFAIGIIVAMVPEGLLPTLTLALVLATQRMAKRHVLIRYLPSVEALGSTTVICTDKTGTLTQNRMIVRQLFLGSTVVLPEHLAQRHDLVDVYRPFFMIGRMCHDLKETGSAGQRKFLGDPMEVALVDMSRTFVPDPPGTAKLDEIPFDADRMRLSIVYQAPEGIVLYTKGAAEVMLPRCGHILLEGKIHQFDAEQKARILQAQEAMAHQGLRVLALAYRLLVAGYDRERLEEDLVFAGLVGLEDPPRPEVPEAVRMCREAGIRVIMVTGDHPGTAAAIAHQVGLTQSGNPTIVTGEQLRWFTPTQLQLALDAHEIIFARVAADQKLRIVEALKKQKHIVAVTGDGINDAPALKAAHIGIAMGIMGTDVAREAADMVLLDDNFASIVNAVEEGRAVFENIRKFLTYVLVHNVAELIPYLAFVLFRIPLALTPIQALSVDMGTDTLTALGLGVEKPGLHVMRRPPLPQTERLMNWRLALRAFFFVVNGAGWKYGQSISIHDSLYLHATTACLSAIIVMQIVNVFLCRSSTHSVFSTGLRGNPLLMCGVITEAALLLVINYTPWGNELLATAGIGMNVWLFIVPFGTVMLILEETRKWIVRRRPANIAAGACRS
jgi:calcium-translocating P-type ATPase